jgi:hypothetical protein
MEKLMDNLVINVELSVNDVNMLLTLMGKTLTETGYYPIMIKMKQQAQTQVDGFNKKVKENESI